MAVSFRAGAAVVSLEAPLGIPMGGYGGRKGGASGAHDDLSARALVLESGGVRVGLVSCDLVSLDPSSLVAFRRLVEQGGELPNAHLLVSVTHTHSGPVYGSFVSRYMSTGVTNPERFKGWAESVPQRMYQALRQAVAALEPARLAVGRGEARVSVHRRLPDGNGEIRLHPHPDGPIDPELLALKLSRPNGTAIATLVNYACHPVVLCEDNLEHSGDYIYYLQQRLAQLGDYGTTLFLNGACGNLNPARRGDFAAAEWVGGTLAEAAHKALQGSPVLAAVDLAAAFDTVALPLRPLPAESAIARYKAHAEAALAAHANPDNYEGRRLAAEVQRAEQLAERTRNHLERIRVLGGANGRMEAQIQALKVGEVDLVCLPGEIFVELGFSIKAGSQGRPCIVTGYSNRTVGYVPTQEAYTEGGYEVTTAALAPGAGEELAAAARRLMNGLRA